MVTGEPSPDELHNRIVAAHSYKLWKEDRGEGRRYFKAHVRGDFGSGKNMVSTMRRWGTALEERGDLREPDHLRTGRRCKVSNDQVKRAIEVFCAGYIVGGEGGCEVWRGYTSLEDAVESGRADAINEIIHSTAITVRALWRRMTIMWPNICNQRRRVDVKCALSAEVKEERKKAAAVMRRWAVKKLDTVVWLDAKKMYIYHSREPAGVHTRPRPRGRRPTPPPRPVQQREVPALLLGSQFHDWSRQLHLGDGH